MKYQTSLLIAMTLIFAACSGGESDGPTDEEAVVTKSFEDFEYEVRDSVGDSAENCGIVEIGESDLESNTCAANSFVNDQEFYAVYQLQGFDSSVGAAITGDASGKVWYWSYDSNPSGGVPASSSTIESDECINASLTGSVDSGYEEIFACD